jgi:hypothetical protein
MCRHAAKTLQSRVRGIAPADDIFGDTPASATILCRDASGRRQGDTAEDPAINRCRQVRDRTARRGHAAFTGWCPSAAWCCSLRSKLRSVQRPLTLRSGQACSPADDLRSDQLRTVLLVPGCCHLAPSGEPRMRSAGAPCRSGVVPPGRFVQHLHEPVPAVAADFRHG